MNTQTAQNTAPANKVAQIDKVAIALTNQHVACLCIM